LKPKTILDAAGDQGEVEQNNSIDKVFSPEERQRDVL
jgi:hypothetical protein